MKFLSLPDLDDKKEEGENKLESILNKQKKLTEYEQQIADIE